MTAICLSPSSRTSPMSVFMQVHIQTAGIVLVIVRLIIRSITQECGLRMRTGAMF